MTADHDAGPARTLAGGRTLLAAFALALVATLGISALPVAGPGPTIPLARALSCIPTDIHDDVRRAAFAFIGTPVAELEQQADHGARRFVFDVEVWVKGNLGTPVVVSGFYWSEPQIGRRMAMILSVDQDGVLRDSDCIHTQPETLLAIAALESEPRSTDPAVLLIGGEFGDSRVMALDGRGRLVGLGRGDGSPGNMAACPGGQRVVELVSKFMYEPPSLIAVRDTATLEVVREAAVPFNEVGSAWPAAMVCADENGDEVLFGLPGQGIYRFADGVEPLHDGSFTAFALTARSAIVTPTQDRPIEGQAFSLALLDLASGEQAPLAQSPQPTQPTAFAFSPDETRLAYFGRAPHDSQLGGMHVHVFDLADGDLLATHHIPAPPLCDSCWGDVAWLDEDTLLVRDRVYLEEEDELVSSVRILRLPDLDVVDEWNGGTGNVRQVAGGLLLTIDLQGVHRLLATSIEDGRQVELRVLGTNNASALVALPALDEAAAATLTSKGPVSVPTPDNPSGQPPTTGEPHASDLLAPAVVLLALAIVVLGATLLWRRRPAGR